MRRCIFPSVNRMFSRRPVLIKSSRPRPGLWTPEIWEKVFFFLFLWPQILKPALLKNCMAIVIVILLVEHRGKPFSLLEQGTETSGVFHPKRTALDSSYQYTIQLHTPYPKSGHSFCQVQNQHASKGFQTPKSDYRGKVSSEQLNSVGEKERSDSQTTDLVQSNQSFLYTIKWFQNILWFKLSLIFFNYIVFTHKTHKDTQKAFPTFSYKPNLTFRFGLDFTDQDKKLPLISFNLPSFPKQSNKTRLSSHRKRIQLNIPKVIISLDFECFKDFVRFSSNTIHQKK